MSITYELGKYYTVNKVDGNVITFRFVGGEPPCGEVNEKRIPLSKIFYGGYITVTSNENLL